MNSLINPITFLINKGFRCAAKAFMLICINICHYLFNEKILVYFLFCSCGFNNNSYQQQEGDLISEPPYYISLEREIDKISQADLTEIGNTITYIPLETSDNILLKPLRSIKVSSLHIAVVDLNRLFIFNHSGNFISQIGRRGGGPGEYNQIYGYTFSFDSKNMYVLADAASKCLEYEVTGKFLKSNKVDSLPCDMLPLTDSTFVFYCLNTANHMRASHTQQSLIISDLNNIKKTYPNYFKMNNKQMINFSVAPFYSCQGNIRFKEYGVDTLYTVTENELFTYSVFSLGNKEIPLNLVVPQAEFSRIIDSYAGSKYFIRSIVEDNDNIYIELNDFNNSLYSYFNKLTNTVKVIGDKGFQNNIDGGLPFFPKYVYNDSILVDYLNAFDLREHVLESDATEMKRLYGKNYDDLVKLANSLDDESNPVVVMVNNNR